MPDESDGRTLIPGQQDVFGVPVVNSQRNVLDIGSHYPISPERLRLFVNGTRQFPQYGAVPEYNHAGPHHELMPSQGDTVTLETAERTRYSVGFEQLYSFAVGLSRDLESGDVVRGGPFDDNDGWFIEQRGGHAPDTCDLVVRSGGTDTVDGSDIQLDTAFRIFTRNELRTAWYRVTPQLWRESSPQGSSLHTNAIGRTQVDPGPEVGNLPIRMQVTRGASSSPLTLEAGSMALITMGDKTQIARDKTHEVALTTDAGADGATWFPRYAMRVDPNREIINTQITNVTVLRYGGNGAVRASVQAHDPSKVQDASGNTLTDGDFSTPDEHSAQNSVLEESTAVDQAAANDGTISTSTTNIGGYQIGHGSRYPSGQGNSGAPLAPNRTRKRGLYSGDIAVVWVRADNSGVSLVLEVTTEQDW